MKNQIKNLLRAGVFVLAAVAAFAFTQPGDLLTDKYGTANNAWYDVTNVSMGPANNQYQCNTVLHPTDQCLYLDASTSNPISGSNGRFIPGSSLIPE
jgi:hypothetical protein